MCDVHDPALHVIDGFDHALAPTSWRLLQEMEQVLACSHAGRPSWLKSSNRMLTPPSCHLRDT